MIIHGKVTERTGSTFVIFGYNGRDGVVTDRNGLLYMRARYYSPEHRRFVNADVIPGEISNAITLNRYAYANGNPVSNVDPFGLSAERGGSPYGAIEYNGVMYPIFVPDHLTLSISKKWTTIKTIPVNGVDFDGLKFFAGTEFEDIDSGHDKQYILGIGGASVFSGVLNSFSDNVNGIRLEYQFQESGTDRRVIIRAGSTDAEKRFDKNADNVPRSVYWSNAGLAGDQGTITSSIQDAYENMTGNETNWNDFFDMYITVDEKHRGSPYTSYLWIDGDGNLMEAPIIYGNDKVEIGKGKFLWFGFDPLLDVPLTGSIPAAQEYQDLFSAVLTSN